MCWQKDSWKQFCCSIKILVSWIFTKISRCIYQKQWFCKKFLVEKINLCLTYMWTIPDLQGDSLKFEMSSKISSKTYHFLTYHFSKSPSSELRIFLYILYIFYISPWNERKIPLMPFWNLSHVWLDIRPMLSNRLCGTLIGEKIPEWMSYNLAGTHG